MKENNGALNSKKCGKMRESKRRGEWRMKENPPNDDVCPICFSDFTLPCRTNCAHWFCGSCILQVWNYGSAFQPCKCPMCRANIKSLTPLKSVKTDGEAETILKTVEQYNHLFEGGVRAIFLKFRETPLLAKRIFWKMIGPDTQFLKWRLFTMALTLLILITPFKFFPPGIYIFQICNGVTLLMVVFVRLVGTYTRQRFAQRAREMAARHLV